MSENHRLYEDTPRGNHWIGTSSSQFSRYRSSPTASSRRYQHITPIDYQDNDSARLYTNDRTNYTSRENTSSDSKTYDYNQNQQPLISPEVIEITKQRTLAVIIFAIVQLYKLYDLIVLKSGLPISGLFYSNSRFNFILKYFFIDSFLLYSLSSFKIPRLTFKTWVIICQLIVMTTITIILSGELEFVFLSSLVATWRKLNTKELSLTGDSINQKILYDSSSHFKGALTIKILPENTAMLNPLHKAYCLPMENSASSLNEVNVPVRINSTAEINHIQLEYRDIYTNQIELKNLTKKEWKVVTQYDDQFLKKNVAISAEKFKEEAETSIKYLSIPLKKTGFYQIKKIVDSNGLNLKIYGSHLIVPQCPVANIAGSGNFDRCIGDIDNVHIEIEGVPPMQLAYTKSVNGKEQTFFDSNLQPESFQSPLQSKSRSTFLLGDLDNLHWARIQSVSINLDTMVTQPGVLAYKIVKIIDGLGNIIDFNNLSDASRKTLGYSYGYTSHSFPKATLEENIDSKSPTKRSIIIHFEDDAPLTEKKINSKEYFATISVLSPNGELNSFNVTTKSSIYEFQAKLPGTYTLETVYSNFCPGVIVGKSNVAISRPIPPKVMIKSIPILDDCIGQVGLNFDLTFTGVPPFHYTTKVYKLEADTRTLYETKRFTSPSTRYQFTYNPKSEGQYEIIFDQLTNDLFVDPIALKPASDYLFTTSMRVKPGARFKQNNIKSLCLGDDTEITALLQGEPPFTLNYDIIEISSNKRKSIKAEDIHSLEFKIKTPKFLIGGEYIVSLISVKDSSSCEVSLTEPDARLIVRRDTPSASFNSVDKLKILKIKQGSSIDIPIKLSGEGQFMIKYAHLNENGKTLDTFEHKFQSNYKPVIQVDKEGRYRLLSVSDSSCIGNIINPNNEFKIVYLEKPSFSVIEQSIGVKETDRSFSKNPICQGNHGSVDLLLSGSPPFTLKYEIMSPNGAILKKTMQVATKYATVKFPDYMSGEYVVTVKEIYDSNYGEIDMRSPVFKTDWVKIKQMINATPNVAFSESGKTFRTCISNIGQKHLLTPINLKVLEGKGPFTITFNVYHESTGRTDIVNIDNITSDRFEFEKIYEGLRLGSHDIAIEKIIDSNNCSIDILEENESHVFISVSDAPKIQLLDSTASYCVGDYVSYQLTGSAPFTIRYQFNGIQLRSKEDSSQFVRLASEPGVISINSISDSTSQCLVNFTMANMKTDFNSLSLLIHPIPSVTVSQGEYLVEDIHEGDQAEVIFSFEGTPPFSLTYVRTEESSSSKMKGKPHVVETHRVTDIFEYEYKVKTSLQGTYEAIEIADSFCVAKNNAYFTN